ncbi:hypothetical protein BO71DRAFT_204458 [Aspergillus ellipticus CBS 707.79]|uniref:Uncharacterized protein n=1 Tax=Aspergillus ellipticus CBS 707.79 TaxID=1448320 RepID=A0A319EVH3_9EURO|nr:hypothetical protein BO71DRAFT_204458 [Aspergillus ellipticus CBS 707.79]
MLRVTQGYSTLGGNQLYSRKDNASPPSSVPCPRCPCRRTVGIRIITTEVQATATAPTISCCILSRRQALPALHRRRMPHRNRRTNPVGLPAPIHANCQPAPIPIRKCPCTHLSTAGDPPPPASSSSSTAYSVAVLQLLSFRCSSSSSIPTAHHQPPRIKPI